MSSQGTCFMEFEPYDYKPIIIQSYCAKQIAHTISFTLPNHFMGYALAHYT